MKRVQYFKTQAVCTMITHPLAWGRGEGGFDNGLQWWYIYVNLSKYHSWTPWFNIQKTGRPKKEF